MKKNINKMYAYIKNNKKLFSFLLVFIFISTVLFISVISTVNAAVDLGNKDLVKSYESAGAGNAMKESVYLAVGWIFYMVASFFSWLASWMMGWLMAVASYDNFVNVPAVTIGWKNIRDLANMFFILILLIIAFATILRVENYNIKKSLPKVILMAILINFSKTICGIIIEFSQIIMMTFVGEFNKTGENQMIDMLGISEMWKFLKSEKEYGDLGVATIMGTLLAMIASLIVLVVILTAMAVFIVRIIMLWIYIVLSPLAYLMAAFPQGQKYASQWWGDFTKYVITGPVLAFFLWLAISTAGESAGELAKSATLHAAPPPDGKFSEFMDNTVFQTYIITIGFLVGGLMVTQQIGGIAASVAGRGIGAIQKGKGMAWNGIKRAPVIAGSYAGRKIKAKTGWELRPSEIMGGVKDSFKQSEINDNREGRRKAGEKFSTGGISSLVGALGSGADGANEFLTGAFGYKGVKSAFKTLRNGPGTIKKANQKYSEDNDKLEDEEGTLKTQLKDIKTYNPRNTEAINAKEKELKDKKKEIDKLKQNHKNHMVDIAPPTAFDGQSAEREMQNEEMKKVAQFPTSEEKLMEYKKAVKSGKVQRAKAILEQLAAEGDSNEFLKEYGFQQNAIGLHEFTQEHMMAKIKDGGLGLSEQEALRNQEYIGSAALKVGQHEYSKTTGVNIDGTLKSLIKVELDDAGNKKKDGKGKNVYDDTEHALAAFDDVSKLDPQVQAKLGRFALGGEDMDGNYQLSSLGKLVMKNFGHAFKDHEKRVQASTAKKLISSSDLKDALKDYEGKGVDKDGDDMRTQIIKALKGRYSNEIDPGEQLKEIRRA